MIDRNTKDNQLDRMKGIEINDETENNFTLYSVLKV